MTGAVARAIGARSPRERALLALLALVVLPLAVLFLLVLPLREAREAAERNLLEAQELAAWVAAEAAAFAAAGGAAAAPAAPSGIAGIERSLTDSGLRDSVERLEDGREGRVALAFGPVPFAAFASYAAGLRSALGYRIEAMRVEATDSPGLVTARLDLAPLP